MINCCSMCGVSIPQGQRIYSMCYGDPDYGRDGIYRKWLEDQQEAEAQEEGCVEDEP